MYHSIELVFIDIYIYVFVYNKTMAVQWTPADYFSLICLIIIIIFAIYYLARPRQINRIEPASEQTIPLKSNLDF